jgi:hypothetical protein
MRFCISHEFHAEYFTALCYIKVLYQKVPELADQEKTGVCWFNLSWGSVLLTGVLVVELRQH